MSDDIPRGRKIARRDFLRNTAAMALPKPSMPGIISTLITPSSDSFSSLNAMIGEYKGMVEAYVMQQKKTDASYWKWVEQPSSFTPETPYELINNEVHKVVALAHQLSAIEQYFRESPDVVKMQKEIATACHLQAGEAHDKWLKEKSFVRGDISNKQYRIFFAEALKDYDIDSSYADTIIEAQKILDKPQLANHLERIANYAFHYCGMRNDQLDENAESLKKFERLMSSITQRLERDLPSDYQKAVVEAFRAHTKSVISVYSKYLVSPNSAEETDSAGQKQSSKYPFDIISEGYGLAAEAHFQEKELRRKAEKSASVENLNYSP